MGAEATLTTTVDSTDSLCFGLCSFFGKTPKCDEDVGCVWTDGRMTCRHTPPIPPDPILWVVVVVVTQTHGYIHIARADEAGPGRVGAIAFPVGVAGVWGCLSFVYILGVSQTSLHLPKAVRVSGTTPCAMWPRASAPM